MHIYVKISVQIPYDEMISNKKLNGEKDVQY